MTRSTLGQRLAELDALDAKLVAVRQTLDGAAIVNAAASRIGNAYLAQDVARYATEQIRDAAAQLSAARDCLLNTLDWLRLDWDELDADEPSAASIEAHA